jgi:hypothetical protein
MLMLPRLASSTVAPPRAGQGVCELCHGPAGHSYRRCWSCELVNKRLGRDRLPPVVPISLFRPGSALHRTLVAYKSSPDPRERGRLSADLAELVAWFLATHGPCIGRAAGGGWDVIDVVPSTRRAGPDHPFSHALASLPLLSSRARHLLRRGASAVAHLEPAIGAFAVGTGVRGARVLLLDDVYTTGSHALSAAAALESAGACVVAIVPIGRLVHAECRPAAAWWQQLTMAPGGSTVTERRCCLGGSNWRAAPQDASLDPKKASTCSSAARVALPSTSRRSSVSTEWAALR